MLFNFDHGFSAYQVSDNGIDKMVPISKDTPGKDALSLYEVQPVNSSLFSGKYVILIRSIHEDDDNEEDVKTFINSLSPQVSFRTINYKDLDYNNLWHNRAIKKLLNEYKIIPVETEINIATKINNVRHQQLYDSFFVNPGTDSKETVHKIFSENHSFDPRTLANYGFQNSSEKEGACIAAKISERPQFLLFNFKDSESFPEGLDFGDPKENRMMANTIKNQKHNQDSAIFTINEKPCNAVVVKLTGRNIYLLAPEKNKKEVQFETLPDCTLYKCFESTWNEYIRILAIKYGNHENEFERVAVPTIRKLLSFRPKNNMKLDTFHQHPGEENDKSFTQRQLKLNKELILIEKQKEFYQLLQTNSERTIKNLSNCRCWTECEYQSGAAISPAPSDSYGKNTQSIEHYQELRKQAESKMTELNEAQKIIETQLKSQDYTAFCTII